MMDACVGRHVDGAEHVSIVQDNAPVADTSNTGDSMYLGSWVAEVCVVHPNGDLIRKYKAQQKRLKLVCV